MVDSVVVFARNGLAVVHAIINRPELSAFEALDLGVSLGLAGRIRHDPESFAMIVELEGSGRAVSRFVRKTRPMTVYKGPDVLTASQRNTPPGK